MNGPTVKIRLQKVTDAKRFYEILTNPSFKYFSAHPKSVKDEAKWLRKNEAKRKKNFEHNFTILYGKEIVGGVGVKINQHRKWIGEIGYFLDEKYWGKGITTKAVKLTEKYCFEKLKLHRIEIIMNPENKGSEKVAIKNKYKKEGLMISPVKKKDGKWENCFLYSKINTDTKAAGLK
jgi:ribosomal-protein-alanine N-acetyltransferase